jgi:hypothetical protein
VASLEGESVRCGYVWLTINNIWVQCVHAEGYPHARHTNGDSWVAFGAEESRPHRYIPEEDRQIT